MANLNGARVLGRVHFRDAKTPAGNRTVPLHPEATEALRGVLDPDADPSALIFTTTDGEGRTRPWDQHTYRKAWGSTRAAVIGNHPDVAGMVMRDLRTVFRTRLTDARIPEPTIRRLMGHSVDVSQGYYELTEDRAREAVLSLTVSKPELYPERDPVIVSTVSIV